MRLELANLGAWGSAKLLAEFDPERQTIRVDASAFARVGLQLGAGAAEAFHAYALAHENFHAQHPRCSEADAHAYARAMTGVDRSLFEVALRT